jgi:hypothetical protein
VPVGIIIFFVAFFFKRYITPSKRKTRTDENLLSSVTPIQKNQLREEVFMWKKKWDDLTRDVTKDSKKRSTVLWQYKYYRCTAPPSGSRTYESRKNKFDPLVDCLNG